MEASNLSDREFRVMIMKKRYRNHKKVPVKIKNAIPEISNTLEGVKNRLEEGED